MSKSIVLSDINIVLKVLLLLGCLINCSWASDVLNDPTRPANYLVQPISSDGQEKAVANEFKVSQILIGQRKRMAIVNGQKVNTGDSIENAKVVAIKSESVQLLINGKLIEISIMPSIKRYKK